MSIREKAAETVGKLLRWTIEKKIQWERDTDTRWLTVGTDDLVEVAYTTKVAENHFVIYEERFRAFDAEGGPYWNANIVLKLVDEQGRTLWPFPKHLAGLSELYNKAQPQAGEVEDRLNKVLEFKV